MLSFPRGKVSACLGMKQFSSLSGRCSPSLKGRKQYISFPGRSFPGRHSPSPGEGGNLAASQATQAGRQAVSQAGAHLPPREGSSLAASPASQAGAHLPSGEGSNSAITQAVPPFLVTALPAKQAVRPPHIPCWGKPFPSRQQPPSSQAGSQVTRSGRQNPRHSARQRALQASQGNSTASQADSTGSQESNPTPNPPNRLPQGSSPEDPNPKWVINLSSKLLTPAQRSVLAKGSNFVVSPKQPPNLEYITTIETACTKLSQQDAEELRAEVNRVLRSSCPPNPT